MVLLTQAAALMTIYNATGGAHWGGIRGKGRAGWGAQHADSVCQWAGVCCTQNATEWGCVGGNSGVVRGLNLGFNRLTGELPDNPAVWQALSTLRSLSLRSNALSGTVPPALGHLVGLLDFNARRNQISGTLPDDLTTLTHLRHLSLYTNRISGTLGAWIGALRSLGTGAAGGLDLRANRLSGTISPAVSELRGFHNNIGLGSGYTCPVPPIAFTNGTISTSYAQCTRRPQRSKAELVAFRSVSYGCSHGNGCIQGSFRHYNWTEISTVITFTQTNLTELCALARVHDARIIVALGKTLNTSKLLDSAYTQQWLANTTRELVHLSEVGVSGVSLDVEHFHSKNISQARQAFSKLVCNLQSSLAQHHLSLHSVCTKIWGDTTHVDLVGLSHCAEYLLPMAYDMIISKGPVASSNAPLPEIRDDLQRYYLSAGVPPWKILLGLPLYGYSFPCEKVDSPSVAVETTNSIHESFSEAPPCRVPTTDSLSTWQMGLGTIFEKQAAGLTSHTGRDAVSQSPFLEFMETRHKPLGRRQVWFEDATSLALKGRALRSQLGLAGVAVWSADALWNAPGSNRTQIWTALRQ